MAFLEQPFRVVTELAVSPPVPPPSFTEVRSLRAMDRDAFRSDLEASVSPALCPTFDQLNSVLVIASYLQGRTQSVLVNNTFSDPANLSFGVPQGSVLGPILFIMYTKHLSSLIDSHSLCNHSFADDTQLYKSCTPSIIDQTIQTTQNCITDIKTWMTTHKLKLNDDKTEVLLIHTNRSFSSNTKPSSILVGNADITFSDSARNLGFILSSDMSLDQHITHICRSAYAALRQISAIRQYLTTEAAKKLVCALVLSRLDYVNALLAGCPKHCLDRLQKVQNSAARLVLKAKKRDHVTPLLQTLPSLAPH